MSSLIGSLVVEIQANTAKLDEHIKQSQRQLRAFDSTVATVKRSMVGLVGVFGARMAFDWLTDATIKMQGFQYSLAAATGSQAQAAQEMRYVQDTAQKLGIRIEDVAGNYARLALMTQGTNMQGEKTRKLFQGMLEAFRTLHTPQMNVVRTFNAIVEMMGTARLQTRFLTQQLSRDFPAGLKAAADAMHMTVGQMEELARQGNLTTAAFLHALAEGTMKKYAESAKEAATGLQAAMNRVHNTMVLLGSGIGEGAGGSALTGVLDGIANSLSLVESHLRSFEIAAVALAGRAIAPLANSVLYWAAANAKAAFSSAALYMQVARGNAVLISGRTAALARAQAQMAAANAALFDAESLEQVALAEAQVAAASARLAEAQAAATVSARFMGGAMTALRAGMGLLGGPAGLIMIAAGAFMYFSQQEDEARRKTAQYISTLDTLKQKYLELDQARRAGMIATAQQQQINLQAQIDAAQQQLDKFQFGGTRFLEQGTPEGMRQIDILTARLDRLKQEYNGLGATIKKWQTQLSSPIKAPTVPSVPGAGNLDKITKMLAKLKEAADTYGMTAAQVELYRLKLAGATPAQLKQAAAFLAQVDSMKSYDAWLKKVTAENAQMHKQMVSDAQALLDKVHPQEALQRQIAAARGLIGTVANGIKVTSADVDKYVTYLRQQFHKNTGSMSQYAIQAFRSIQQAAAQFFFDPFKNGLKGMLQSFIDVIRQMIANWMAAQAIMAAGHALVNNSSKGSLANEFGQWMLSAIGSAKGLGGPVSAGVSYTVGDHGPETFTPSTDGYITPNAGGSINWNAPAAVINVDMRGAGPDEMAKFAAERRLLIEEVQSRVETRLTRHFWPQVQPA